MKRTLTIVVLIVVIAAAFYTYRVYTAKVQGLEEVDSDAKVTATDLIAAFEKDFATANKKYLGKIVEVTGNLKNIEIEAGSIVLGNENSMSSVRCGLDTNYVKKLPGLNPGSQVTIKGACTGFNADDELGLGSDVVLNRCVILTNKN